MKFLLSHNYSLPEAIAPAIASADFCNVFAAYEQAPQPWTVRLLTHPHWRCAVVTELSPEQTGQLLLNALVSYRQQHLEQPITYTVMALGGIKRTPVTSNHPDTLQIGEWGVDIVETLDADSYLQTIGWATVSAERPPEDIFKVVFA